MNTMMKLIALSTGKGELAINGVNIPVYITDIEHNSRGIMYGGNETIFKCMALEAPKRAGKKTAEAIPYIPAIDKVLFKQPATIVFWEDGTKTVVKSSHGEAYDPEKGLAMAITKKALGNKGNYYNVLKKHFSVETKKK